MQASPRLLDHSIADNAGKTAGMASTAISPAVSVALDLMRFLLALIVVFSHLTQPYFQTDWPNMTGFAVVSVGGFFILSGYTIRSFSLPHAAFDARRFFVDRASRLLSISLLALAATILLDLYSFSVAPVWYDRNWGGDTDHAALRLAANVFLFSQAWGADIVPFSNSPFWSLSYEAGFYAIWGTWLYCRRARKSNLVPVAIALAFGPDIMFMMLFWLIGVAIYDQFAGEPSRRKLVLLFCFGTLAALLQMACFVQLKPALTSFIHAVFQVVGCNPQRITASLLFGAILFAFFLVSLLAALKLLDHRLCVDTRIVSSARRLGEATFPLYLFHFPILVAIGATHLLDVHSSVQKFVVLIALVLFSTAIVPVGLRLKLALRSLLTRALQRRTVAP